MKPMYPVERARHEVYEYVKAHLDPTDDVPFTENDVYLVTFGYMLGSWKAMVSTNLPDGMYYEVTFDPDEGAVYIDAYKRFDQKVVTLA